MGRSTRQRVSLKDATLSRLAGRFCRDDAATTAIEYSLIAGGISVAIIVVVTTLGTNVSNLFVTISNAFN
jgi:pilus assembly protein Flp/PilA